ncbi:hypothetical protein [Limosilactobacillus galli]|uniref:hypothetical protein n=1 Tax=Limosilactobacillus galli TaxID=2991834 RepID=UPI0024B91D9C|nr:hypothetical protein [Limosilactobacillus galli]
MNLLVTAGMSDSDLISHLYDEINRQNTWYMWTVGILVTLITLIIAYFSIIQWRISDKQISKMQAAINDANKKAKELTEMNNILVKNSLLNLAGSQFLGGLPDWRSDIEFYNYIKSHVSKKDEHLIKYVKSKIANDFALSVNEACNQGMYYPNKYVEYKKDNPKAQYEYVVSIKEEAISRLIDSLDNMEEKRRLFSDFQEFLKFWNSMK